MLKHFLSSLNLDSNDLDDLVIDAASAMASNANNGGLSDQLTFLSCAGWSDSEVIKEVVGSRLTVGQPVNITDPKHDDSTHLHAFSGHIHSFLDGCAIRVVDGDDNAFDVEWDEIEPSSFLRSGEVSHG